MNARRQISVLTVLACWSPRASSYAWWLLLGVTLGIVGCRTPPSAQREVDAKLARYAKSGKAALDEGFVAAAETHYRRALRRAWAMDDPLESGTSAYNLAACLTSQSDSLRARDWLLDARIELCRAGASPGNVWLLEAAIAQDEFRYDDADCYLQNAQAANPPCGDSACRCSGCCPADPCRERCIAKIPAVGPRLDKRRTEKECRRTFQAQVCLARARSAAEQYNVAEAQMHFQRACRHARHVCSDELQAELQNVAGHIHIAAGQYYSAACHFDREAEYLRLAGNYRVIPASLRLAAAAYQQAGLTEQSAARWLRVARVLIGRGQPRPAWRELLKASELAATATCSPTTVRLACTAHELEQLLAENGDSLDPESPPADMISSEMELEAAGTAGQADASISD